MPTDNDTDRVAAEMATALNQIADLLGLSTEGGEPEVIVEAVRARLASTAAPQAPEGNLRDALPKMIRNARDEDWGDNRIDLAAHFFFTRVEAASAPVPADDVAAPRKLTADELDDIAHDVVLNHPHCGDILTDEIAIARESAARAALAALREGQ